MLEVRGLRAGYGRIPILHGIELRVARGEYVGILGHNGMGKTTLLKSLIGLLKPTAGSIQLDGADITNAPPYRRQAKGLGYIPQGREIYPALSVLDNLRMGCAQRSADTERQTIDRIFEEFPRLQPLRERMGGSLSGGEQQILAIARGLCSAPRMLLLDEPTEGIQPSIVDEIVEKLDSLRHTQQLTVVLVEQNLEFIAALSQRVVVIQKGVLVRELSPEHLDDADVLSEFVGVAGQA